MLQTVNLNLLDLVRHLIRLQALAVELALVNDGMLTVAVQDTDIRYLFLRQIVGEERTKRGLTYATFLIRPSNGNVLSNCCMFLYFYCFN